MSISKKQRRPTTHAKSETKPVYISIKKVGKGGVKRTIDLDGNVLIDKDENEDIVGVEVIHPRDVRIDGKSCIL